MAPAVAIVTGRSSGLGLALVRYLVARSWNTSSSLLSHDLSKPPVRPDMTAFAVNLDGIYFGIKLGTHYMSLDSTAAGKPKPGGKFTVTSSSAGIHCLPGSPQYTATKYGLVGLICSLGFMQDGPRHLNIRLNAICPGMLNTPFVPTSVQQSAPSAATPLDLVLRVHEQLSLLSHATEADWVTSGPTGQTVEANVDTVTWHKPPVSTSKPDQAALNATRTLVSTYRGKAIASTKRQEQKMRLTRL